MSKGSPSFPVALLFSTVGNYAALGREAVAGALAAIVGINGDERLNIRLEPSIMDATGCDQRYGALTEAAIRNGTRHIIGTITSSGRKEVIPVVERNNALLWYAFPYEGYEASDRTLYFGACPNQHLLPLFDHVLPRAGLHPFVVGSNYIWGWEVARIARELTEAHGGVVLGDRYLPLGSTVCTHLIAEIREKKPDFILSNLVGESMHAFLRAYQALGCEDGAFRPENCPVVSCNLTQTDLDALGAVAEGHITASAYFDVLDTPENIDFKAAMQARQGLHQPISSCFASVYSATRVLGMAMAEAGTDDPDIIRELVVSRQFETPLGALALDAATQHARLTPYLASVEENGRFNLIDTHAVPVAADPYLSGPAAREALRPRTFEQGQVRANTLKVIK